MISSIKNKNKFYKLSVSFLILIAFAFFSKVKKVDKVYFSHSYSLQEKLIKQNDQGVLANIEYHPVVINFSIFQKKAERHSFSFKFLALQNVIKKEAFPKNLSILISKSHILIGESNLLKIIFPFHQFW